MKCLQGLYKNLLKSLTLTSYCFLFHCVCDPVEKVLKQLNLNLLLFLFQGSCSQYITAWKTWPGGVTGTFVVHNETDPTVNTWALTLAFEKVGRF